MRTDGLQATDEPNVWQMILIDEDWDDPLHKEHHICYVEINNFNNGSAPRLPPGRDEVTNLWYSYTEHYERESKRKHWKKSHSATYKLSRELKSAIIAVSAG